MLFGVNVALYKRYSCIFPHVFENFSLHLVEKHIYFPLKNNFEK